jgi:hypothetical protein
MVDVATFLTDTIKGFDRSPSATPREPSPTRAASAPAPKSTLVLPVRRAGASEGSRSLNCRGALIVITFRPDRRERLTHSADARCDHQRRLAGASSEANALAALAMQLG